MWLCPFKLYNEPGFLKVRSGDWQMYVDIGVYGVPKAKGFETVSFYMYIMSVFRVHYEDNKYVNSKSLQCKLTNLTYLLFVFLVILRTL